MEQLILIHGALGSAEQMKPLEVDLKNQFQTHILEFEGHGRHSNIDDAFTTATFINQLDKLTHQFSDPVHLFGYSMGGFIALLSAANGNNKIKSITTLGTKMRWSPGIAEQEIRHLSPQKIKDKVPAFATALERLHGGHWERVLIRTSDYMKKLGMETPITKECYE